MTTSDETPSRTPRQRNPWQRIGLLALVSIPAAVVGLWDHDTEILFRLALCILWFGFGYWWGWQDRKPVESGASRA